MAKARPNPPVVHMIVALAVLLVPILLIAGFFTQLPARPSVPQLDPTALAQQAAAEAPYEVVLPQHLPEGWVCTRARWTPVGQPGLNDEPAAGNTWALGYLSPAEMYIAVDQIDRQPRRFIEQVTRSGREDGTSEAGGRTWTRYVSADDRTRALVATQGEVVTIVSGDLGYDALEAFAGTLAPVAAPAR